MNKSIEEILDSGTPLERGELLSWNSAQKAKGEPGLTSGQRSRVFSEIFSKKEQNQLEAYQKIVNGFDLQRIYFGWLVVNIRLQKEKLLKYETQGKLLSMLSAYRPTDSLLSSVFDGEDYSDVRTKETEDGLLTLDLDFLREKTEPIKKFLASLLSFAKAVVKLTNEVTNRKTRKLIPEDVRDSIQFFEDETKDAPQPKNEIDEICRLDPKTVEPSEMIETLLKPNFK